MVLLNGSGACRPSTSRNAATRPSTWMGYRTLPALRHLRGTRRKVMEEKPVVRTMFRIPEDNLEGLLAALDKVRRKAEKLHSGAITWVVYTTQPEVVKSKDSHGIERVRTWFPVEVVGPQPKIHGWTFVATLEHLENGNLVRGVEGLVTEGELTQFRQMTSACDHCKQKRNRIDTFVLRSDQGEYMQLGRRAQP